MKDIVIQNLVIRFIPPWPPALLKYSLHYIRFVSHISFLWLPLAICLNVDNKLIHNRSRIPWLNLKHLIQQCQLVWHNPFIRDTKFHSGYACEWQLNNNHLVNYENPTTLCHATNKTTPLQSTRRFAWGVIHFSTERPTSNYNYLSKCAPHNIILW